MANLQEEAYFIGMLDYLDGLISYKKEKEQGVKRMQKQSRVSPAAELQSLNALKDNYLQQVVDTKARINELVDDLKHRPRYYVASRSHIAIIHKYFNPRARPLFITTLLLDNGFAVDMLRSHAKGLNLEVIPAAQANN